MREPFSAVDAAWLRMDRPNNRMMITAVVIFDRAPDPEALARVLEERLLVQPRFRQRVVQRLGRPFWEPDPQLDLRSHLHHVALPAPGGAAELMDLVSDLTSSPLDRERPLWQLHLVDGARFGAAVVRLHHCIGDGISLVRLLLSMTRGERGGEPAHIGVTIPRAHGLVGRARLYAREARSALHLLTLPPDSPTLLSGPLGVRKRVAWTAPLPLEPLRERAHRSGATLTDVVLSAATGALADHLETHGGLTPGLEVRAMVPVSLRADDSGEALGNRFGLVYLPLPLDIRDPHERLHALARRMAAVKASPDAAVAFGVLGVLGVASAAVERFGVELFTRKATLLATSVPRPPAPVELAGARVRQLVVFAPASGRMGVTLSMLSYAGTITVGVASDAGLLPHPEAVIGALEHELAAPAPAPPPEAHP